MSSNKTQVCGKHPRDDKEYDSDDLDYYDNTVNDHPYVNNTDDNNTKDDDATTGGSLSSVSQVAACANDTESDEDEVCDYSGQQSQPSLSSTASSSRKSSPILSVDPSIVPAASGNGEGSLISSANPDDVSEFYRPLSRSASPSYGPASPNDYRD